MFNASEPSHAAVADLGERCEEFVASLELTDGRRFESLRADIRSALVETGLASELDAAVGPLLG